MRNLRKVREFVKYDYIMLLW